MIRNYFTLYHAAMELHERLCGGYVVEIYSQDKNELRLSFIDGTGVHMQIVVVTHTPLLSFFIREGVSKKKSRFSLSDERGLSEKGCKC